MLDIAARDEAVRRGAKTRADVQRLWEVCQVPDYRKVSPAAHAEFALALYGYVVRAGRIPDLWYAQQVALYDRTEGDIDALSARIAQVRTLTYIANRPDWLGDPEHWQGVTRQLEDRLSDALHERLAQRFVDRRTSVLMRRLRENAMLEAEITAGGDVVVEGQHVGQLHGFRFTPDPQAAGEAAKALNAAALKALGGEIEARADRFAAAVDDSFALANDGTIRWLGDPVAKLSAGDKLLAPRARIVADEYLTGPALETVQRRLDLWLAQHIKKHLGVLFELEAGEGLDGIVRGIAFQVAEALGVLERSRVADEMKGLDQTARGTLRKLGLRFGAYHIYMPALVKPAPRALAAQLWALRHGGVEAAKGLDEVPHLAASGRTSFVADPEVPKGLYRAAGFRVCGARAVRVDILERLADLIRPAIAYRPGTTPGAPPPGTADADGFVTTVQMTSLAGCSGEDFASILKALGYVLDRRAGPAITVPLMPMAPVEPLKPTPAPAAADSAVADQDVPAEESTAGEPVEGLLPDAEAAPVEAEAGRAEIPVDDGTLIDGTGVSRSEEVPAEPEAVTVSDAEQHPAAPAPAEPNPAPDGEAAPAAEALVPDAAAPDAPAPGEDTTAEAAPVDAASESSASDAAPSEASAETAGEEAAPDEPATPAEPVLIEVWRPHRTNHHAQRRPDGRGPRRDGGRPDGRRGPPQAAGEGAVAAEGTPGGERRDDRRGARTRPDHRGPGGGDRRFDRDRRPQPATATDGSAPQAPAEAAPGEARAARPARDFNAPPRNGGAGKPRFEGRGGGDRGGDRGGPRRDGRRDEGRGPQNFSTEAPRPAPRDRQPDPNSPFAKLMALKAEMERGKKES